MAIYIINPDYPIHLFFSEDIIKNFISNKQDIKVLSRQTDSKTIRNRLINKSAKLEIASAEFNQILKTKYYTNKKGSFKNSFQSADEIKNFFYENISNSAEIKSLFENSYDIKYITIKNAIHQINYNLNYELLKNNLELNKLINTHKRNLTKDDLTHQIKTSKGLELFHYFLLNYFQIISKKTTEKEFEISELKKITEHDFEDINAEFKKRIDPLTEPTRIKKILEKNNVLNNFNDVDRFKNVINIRIDFNEIKSDIEKIEQLPDVTFLNKTKFFESLIEFLHKNAFIELSSSIYSYNHKNYVSYFDIEKLINRLYEIDQNVKDTKELEFRYKIRQSFHSKNKIDFSKKILELESFNYLKNRKKILYQLISNCIKFNDGLIKKHRKTKILKPFYKKIYLAVFPLQDKGNSDSELIKELTKLRRTLKPNSSLK